MDSQLFFEQFGYLIESPKGLQKMRKLILELAVRGKLVPQNPDDESASKLFKQISATKEILIETGKLKKQQTLPLIREDEKLYKLPEGWKWVRMQDIFDVRDGTHDTPKYVESGIPLITSKDIYYGSISFSEAKQISYEDHFAIKARSHVERYDILFSMIGSIGNQAIVDTDEEFSIKNVALFKYYDRNLTLPWYLKRYLEYLVYILKDVAGGGVQKFVSLTFIREFLFPLAPIGEQQRIVAKVDELMQICDQLEEEQIEQENLRVSAAKSTLHHLTNAPSKSEALNYWQYAEQHFTELFNQVSTVEELRAAILQLAVQGRLVPQNPDDEPAYKLLKNIDTDKQALIKAGKIKKTEKMLEIKEADKLYPLPHGWEWVRLDRICWLITDGTHYTPNYISTGVPFLSVKDVSSGQIDFGAVKFISQEDHELLSKRCKPEFHDILLTKVGTTGIAVLIETEQEFSIFVSLALIKYPKQYIYPAYLTMVLNSPPVKKQSEENTQGIGNKNLVLRLIKNFLIPLPPLEEQKRIVFTVNELMKLCEQLEREVEYSRNLSAKLMDSLIYHLFNADTQA